MTWQLLVELVLISPVWLIDLVLGAEVMMGLASVRKLYLAPPVARSIAILVPAHNEAATLKIFGTQLAALAAPGCRILLVADNCSDSTAFDARKLGLEVIERSDSERRGKGFALAFGRDHLALHPPGVVVALDADCLTDRGSLDRLAHSALVTGRPVQAAYLFRPAPDAPPSVQFSNFAFAVKNRVRQRGATRMGAAALLTGSGMAFPWRLFADLDLATGNVVEDLALGISLVEQGQAPIYEDAAIVWSDCAGEAATLVQRSRWEGGFLSTGSQFVGRLVRSGIVSGDWKKFWMGLHLMVPPLSLLAALNCVALVAMISVSLTIAPVWPLHILLGLQVWLGVVFLCTWIVEGRQHLHARALIRLPVYVFWKLALLLRIARGHQQVAWLRTDRREE